MRNLATCARNEFATVIAIRGRGRVADADHQFGGALRAAGSGERTIGGAVGRLRGQLVAATRLRGHLESNPAGPRVQYELARFEL